MGLEDLAFSTDGSSTTPEQQLKSRESKLNAKEGQLTDNRAIRANNNNNNNNNNNAGGWIYTNPNAGPGGGNVGGGNAPIAGNGSVIVGSGGTLSATATNGHGTITSPMVTASGGAISDKFTVRAGASNDGGIASDNGGPWTGATVPQKGLRFSDGQPVSESDGDQGSVADLPYTFTHTYTISNGGTTQTFYVASGGTYSLPVELPQEGQVQLDFAHPAGGASVAVWAISQPLLHAIYATFVLIVVLLVLLVIRRFFRSFRGTKLSVPRLVVYVMGALIFLLIAGLAGLVVGAVIIAIVEVVRRVRRRPAAMVR